MNRRAMTKWSCAVKLLDSCRTSFPLWLAVWRLTAGLSSRPPPCSPRSHRPFSSYPQSSTPTLFICSWETILKKKSTLVGSVILSAINQRAKDEKQRTRRSQVQSQPEREHKSHALITCHGNRKFLNCFEMMAKYINDLMSKYLLSSNVSRKEKKNPEK